MATIVMSADKVIAAAIKVICDIRLIRSDENTKMIYGRIARMEKDIIRRIFNRKPITREDAINSLSKDTWGWYPSSTGDYRLGKAKKLLLLAQHGDPVTLNEEDISILFKD